MALKRATGDALAAEIARRTGHAFRDVGLLQRALTHASAVNVQRNNERLEFLGDRVLALAVADMLYSALPDASEGELAPRFNALVEARTCAEVGMEIGLDELVRAHATVKAHSGKGYLADAVEALIAAIYLDGGMEAARAFILRHWQKRSSGIVVKPRNAKSEVQEWLAQRTAARPAYSIAARSGPDHEPVFTVELAVEGYDPATGQGRSRQAAEQAAAGAFLVREGVWETEGTAA